MRTVSLICLSFILSSFLESCTKENKKIYKIKVGDTFKISLHSNGSTGYSNCWLNQSTVKSVELIDKLYTPDHPSLIGTGGEETLTFKAVAKGSDSIKYASCPTGREQKRCEAYSDGSVKADTVFIAIVTE
jgi:predicted secreted protein